LNIGVQVIQAVPNALGALCLNQEGLRQLSTRPTIIPGLMSIFTSPRHIKLLADKENAVLVGTAIDELIRHHPTLKTTVLDSIKSILSRIEDMGNAFVPSPEDKQWYSLLPSEESPDAATLSATSDVTMEEDTLVAPAPAVGTGIATPAGNEQSAEEISSIHTNDVVAFIDVFGRVSICFSVQQPSSDWRPTVPRRLLPTSPALRRLRQEDRRLGPARAHNRSLLSAI
jgi:E3 ubiquitin-protein ligase HUWE1